VFLDASAGPSPPDYYAPPASSEGEAIWTRRSATEADESAARRLPPRLFGFCYFASGVVPPSEHASQSSYH
jgi:hypothetical protein